MAHLEVAKNTEWFNDLLLTIDSHNHQFSQAAAFGKSLGAVFALALGEQEDQKPESFEEQFASDPIYAVSVIRNVFDGKLKDFGLGLTSDAELIQSVTEALPKSDFLRVAVINVDKFNRFLGPIEKDDLNSQPEIGDLLKKLARDIEGSVRSRLAVGSRTSILSDLESIPSHYRAIGLTEEADRLSLFIDANRGDYLENLIEVLDSNLLARTGYNPSTWIEDPGDFDRRWNNAISICEKLSNLPRATRLFTELKNYLSESVTTSLQKLKDNRERCPEVKLWMRPDLESTLLNAKVALEFLYPADEFGVNN